MSYRNTFNHNAGKHYSDPVSSRYNFKYNRRGGRNSYRQEFNCTMNNGDDIDILTKTIDRSLRSSDNFNQDSSVNRSFRNRRPIRSNHQSKHSQMNQTGWWRVTIEKAGIIGKDRVISTLKAHCPRQFQPYHYFIDPNTKSGIFFVNNQQDADMLKRANGKVEVQSLDILRILVGRASAPIPSLDEDLRAHFKDYLIRDRFNAQTFQLDLSNLADDEKLSSLGIFPQFNKHAFIRDLIDIINKNLQTTRQLDLGSNKIMSLYEFRNLRLDNLTQLSLASNQLKNVEEFHNFKQLNQLCHILIKNNPFTLVNNQNNQSMNEIISTIQKKLPQLKRIDDTDLAPVIRFATDISTVTLPQGSQHYIPNDVQAFLMGAIDQYYQFFDKPGRSELHACYHDSCLFSLCIAKNGDSHVPIRQFKYSGLVSDSRNLQFIHDYDRLANLLKHGKKDVLGFLTTKFPSTKHDRNSFNVDVILKNNDRIVFTINGLYKEENQATHNPIRCFQRTFTFVQTSTGCFIVADHMMLSNATEAQISKMTNSSSTVPSSQTPINQSILHTNTDIQNQEMIHRFSQQSGMNIEYSKLCLQEYNWNYDIAAAVFLDLQNQNKIPPEAFNKS